METKKKLEEMNHGKYEEGLNLPKVRELENRVA